MVSRIAGAADASPLLDPDQPPLREDPPACWYAGQCTCDQGHPSAVGGERRRQPSARLIQTDGEMHRFAFALNQAVASRSGRSAMAHRGWPMLDKF